MKRISRLACVLLLACSGCMLFVATGCSSSLLVGQQQTEVPEATQNRNFMASVNRLSADLQTTLDTFQTAVAANDSVTMQAQLREVSRIIGEVNDYTVTDTLKPTKEAYVDALNALNTAMNSYVSLYNDVKAGKIDDATFNSRLAEVQSAYDAGIEKMKAADETVTTVSKNDSKE